MMDLFQKYRSFGLILLILFGIVMASWYMIHGNINFHTDVARDFLLLEDIFYNKNITLLGPRSGGIPGVFHGPLWLYLNLPAYILGQGNPVVVGWFWVFLFIISVAIVYEVGKRMFTMMTGLIASAIYSISAAPSVHAMFNPFGAVILAPLFFFFFWSYIQKKSFLYLSATILTLGFIIQFQMAFGGPLLVLITPYLVYQIFTSKRFIHLLAFGLLVIPLSTFIVFELRNDFLQVKSVINYIGGAENAGKVKLPLHLFLWNRLSIMTQEAVGMLTGYNAIISLITVVLFALGVRRAAPKDSRKYTLFMFLYVGFWIITLPYKGVMWGYYYWPFLSIFAIIIASLYRYIDKRLFIALFVLICISNVALSSKTVFRKFDEKDTSLWQFYRTIASRVYADAPSEFGYYIYTNDQYGYSSRYAMNQIQREYPDKKAFPYEKKTVTYLLIDDPGNHKFTNHKGWRSYDVKIQSKPVKKELYSKTYWIEKYTLSQKEIEDKSNPNLIQNLIFR